MRRLGLKVRVAAAGINEAAVRGATPEDVTARVAAAKVRALDHSGEITVTADTAVVIDGKILGKPRSAEEARAMLERLWGRTHRVITAIAVARDGRTCVDVVSTEVTMRHYTSKEIEAYIASGDPFDKAGAYAIQHPGFHPVARIRGCYQNIVGLPLCHLCKRLEQEGVRIPHLPPGLCRRDLGQECPVALYPQA